MRFRTLSGASKGERLAARALSLPKGVKLVPGPTGGAVYTYEFTTKDGRTAYALLTFWGSSAKSNDNTWFRSEAARTDAIEKFHASLRAHTEFKAKRSAENKAWTNPAKVGDVLYTSWGYDQTNVEFYAVTKVSGRRVWVREVKQSYVETGFMSGRTKVALPLEFAEKAEETMHTAQPSGEKGYSVKINESATAWLTTNPESEHYTSSYA